MATRLMFMYIFGAILIYTVRFDPSIVYTSNIFAILGLRAMCFLLTFPDLLGFALVLLSMFFFFFLTLHHRSVVRAPHLARSRAIHPT